MPFYAVKKGRVPGIYSTWDDCKEQIDNFPNAWYKKFKTEIEADKCMKSRRSIVVGDNGLKSKFWDPTAKTFSPADIEILKIQLEIIKEKVASCISLFSKRMKLLSKRIDMVEQDISSVSLETRHGGLGPHYFVHHEVPQSFPHYTNGPIYSREEMWLGSTNDNYTSAAHSINNTWKYALDTRRQYVPPLIEDREGFIDVYIDGAVKNKGTEFARGGIGVWFNNGHPLNIADAMQGYPTTINAEMEAATRAIQQAAAAGLRKLNIHTDSTYMIFAITKWIKFWRANNWRTTMGNVVKIRDEIEKLEDAVNSMEGIKWTYIRSHQGNEGNENADILAHVGVTMNGHKKFYKYRFPEELKSQPSM